ncbi:MAG: FMN-binding negative transcriptional regulator [Planctomycetes bacterium]|nr:FMN-binding negative transcriptional regulator [Planctomycetota bacterium]
MYVPAHFAVTDRAALHDFIEAHSFGLLVSEVAGAPFATHLPFLLERERGPHGALVGHVARANPHWKELATRPALAVFSGPHAYISPRWYEAENVVPTWNYVAVHATGRAIVIEKPGELLEIVRRSVEVFEAGEPQPWELDTSGPFVERLLAQIVGFRIEIEALEGKWKLNQNHTAERRVKVVRALDARGGANARGIAGLMRAALVPGE